MSPPYKHTGGYFLPDRYASIAISAIGKSQKAETRPETIGYREKWQLAEYPTNTKDIFAIN